MKRIVLLLAIASFFVAARAEAKHFRFQGTHPIPEAVGGGYCYIEAPHVHVYEPGKADVLYRNEPDGYAFVGDPVPYGYDGPKYSYYGHHPIYVNGDAEEYCYLDGPHYHGFAPPERARFKLKGGVYFFAGSFPSVYVEGRPRYTRINTVYRPLRYTRPVVVEAPPPEYTGPVMVTERPTVVVPSERPMVEAGFSVQIGTPPPPTVIVHDERPVYVRERPVYVREREVIIERERHDHGKHKGWKKWHD
jgi:hypothetical protein